jgi:hypothetical protein
MALDSKRIILAGLHLMFFWEIKTKKNDVNIFITIDNWEQLKDDFYKYRFSIHPKSYQRNEIINTELKKIIKLKQMALDTQAKNEFNVLISRYEDYLNELLKQKTSDGLSANQKSLRQWYLEIYENEPKLQGREIGIKLNQTSCEGFLNSIRKFYDSNKKHDYTKKNVKNDFAIVKELLSNYPNASKAIENDIDFNIN